MRESKSAGRQPGLFGPPPPDVGPAPASSEDVALAAALPGRLRFGTSSWTFPGWAGQVYDRLVTESVLAREGLAAYAAHPLLGAVGIDRGWYRPVPAEVFAGYAAAVPPGFRFLVKAHEDCTRPFLDDGSPNPRLLDPEYAAREVVVPASSGLGEHLAAVLYQVPPSHAQAFGGTQAFARRLRAFLGALPPDVPRAVELRTPGLFTAEVGAALAETGTIPCLNVWTDVPDLRTQARTLRASRAPMLLLRWLLPPGLRYREAKERFAPFAELREPDPRHRGVLTRAIRAYLDAGKDVVCIVTNRAEGCAPRSIRHLARAVVAPPST